MLDDILRIIATRTAGDTWTPTVATTTARRRSAIHSTAAAAFGMFTNVAWIIAA